MVILFFLFQAVRFVAARRLIVTQTLLSVTNGALEGGIVTQTLLSVTNAIPGRGYCHVNEAFCDDWGCRGGDCHDNAAICDKCCSSRGYCHVNEVFCDDWGLSRR